MSRMYYDEATGILYGGFRYPGVVEHVGALNTRDGSVRRLADIKRAMSYQVDLARLRSRQRDRLLHERQPGRCATSWRWTSRPARSGC